MSRILRRPMFRGGRVDSRGTGITSGLSYAKGGRVGLNSSFPGTAGQAYTFKNLEDYKNYIKFQDSFKPQLFGGNKIYSDTEIDSMVDKGKFANRPWWDFTGIFDLGMGIAGPSSDFIQGLQYEKTDAGKSEYRKELMDERDKLIKQSQAYSMSIPEGVELSETEQAKQKAAQLKLDLEKKRIAELANKSDDTEEKPTIDKDALTERKELFAELLGGGKARGEDISNMLMSFAGKALKPEATVKGAFGEFFDEESKRPSSKTKVDQAAAQLAINDYIAGRKSDRAFKDAMDIFDAKLRRQAEAGSVSGKDFQTALTIVQDRYKGQYKRNSDTVISETLTGLFKKPVDSVSGELDDVKTEDLSEGFTILNTKKGKIIIEKIGETIRVRDDLIV